MPAIATLGSFDRLSPRGSTSRPLPSPFLLPVPLRPPRSACLTLSERKAQVLRVKVLDEFAQDAVQNSGGQRGQHGCGPAQGEARVEASN